MRTTKMLLELLTKAYPPPAGAKHAVLVYEGKLHVVLALPEKSFQHLTLEDADLDRSAEALFADIVELLFRRDVREALSAEKGQLEPLATPRQMTEEEAERARPGFKAGWDAEHGEKE